MFESGPLSYIWQWANEVGFNDSPVTWTEIKSWSDMSGIAPNPNECSAMIILSRSFINEISRSRLKGALPLDECMEYLDG